MSLPLTSPLIRPVEVSALDGSSLPAAVQDRAVLLIRILESLIAASTVDQAIAVILREGAECVGATQGRVLLYADDNGVELEVAGAVGLPRDLAERRIGPELHSPGHDAVRRRVTIAMESTEEWQTRYPALAELLEGSPLGAIIAAPLEYEERVLGAIELALPAPRALTASEQDVLATLARHGGLVIDRLRRGEAEHEARVDAERANQVKADFLAVVSHELRTPLNAIGGYTELLQMGIRGPLTPTQEEDLRRIDQSQRHLLSLVNAILDFAKLEAGRVSFVLSDVPAAELLADIEPLVQPQARAKGVALRHDLCDASIRVIADREKLQQVLLNLLTNAIKFTPEGGTVSLRCAATRRHASFSISDTGIGIPASKMERIFEPFVQVNRSLSTPNEGVGLGLAISRELARGMLGVLKAASAVGEGSTFTLTLPRATE